MMAEACDQLLLLHAYVTRQAFLPPGEPASCELLNMIVVGFHLCYELCSLKGLRYADRVQKIHSKDKTVACSMPSFSAWPDC